MLCQLHGGYLRPLVSYNPWTDILEQDASLKRVCKARACGFVGAKIYPAIGFMPANNASTKVRTSKRRPDLTLLDKKLKAFFAVCAEERIPILAHGEAKNGRDDAHDDFGGPKGWAAYTRVTRGRPTPRWSASGTSAAWLRSRPGPGSSPSS